VGNHDFWTGNFFTEILGICVHKSPIEVTLQNRKIFIAHGNEITRFDFLRWILRNKLSIFLFYWIHPDFAQIIGRCVSTLSTKTRKSIKWERLYKIGEQKFNQGFDAVIFGHIHCPKHIKKSNKDFLLLGDWIRHFSYVRLMDGKFTLSVWKRPSQPSQVLDILYK
jgi:UDP-2,3-diacylglucosamine hydrolase